jgi:hypothetical protein
MAIHEVHPTDDDRSGRPHQIPRRDSPSSPPARRDPSHLPDYDAIKLNGLFPVLGSILGLPTAEQKHAINQMKIRQITELEKELAHIEPAAVEYISMLVVNAARRLQAEMDYMPDYDEGTPMNDFLLDIHQMDLDDLKEIRRDLIERPRRARMNVFPD